MRLAVSRFPPGIEGLEAFIQQIEELFRHLDENYFSVDEI
jgi:hypothetical protein